MSLQADRPIMLITATPGGGKTALAVKIMKEAVEAGRPLFVMGIPDLNLPHSTCPPIKEWTETREDPDNPDLSLPFFTFPPNALIVLDEAQRVFRLRASASKVPDHVAAFETVRHTGVTFILITQHPNFIDSHIRNLVGQHVHLRDVGLLGRWYYEWPEVADPKTFTTAPIKKKWSLPKESFGLYKSSSLHIKRNYSMPPALVILAVCLFAMIGGGFYVWSSVGKKLAPEVAQVQQQIPSALSQPSAPATYSNGQPVQDATEMLLEFTPLVRGRPETAPAYAALKVVKVMPYVVGCFQTRTICACQNQQGLDAGLDPMQCRDWIKNPPFNPYREEPAAVASVPGQPNGQARARAPGNSDDPTPPASHPSTPSEKA